jgi:hypothetical protein
MKKVNRIKRNIAILYVPLTITVKEPARRFAGEAQGIEVEILLALAKRLERIARSGRRPDAPKFF